MKESEIRTLFLKISNRYTNFAYDDFKVNDWLELLGEVPIERATENLRRYCLDAANTFPPHPGILAENPGISFDGNYVPNAEDTRLMLENHDLMLCEDSSSIPESAIERMRQLGYKPTIEQSE